MRITDDILYVGVNDHNIDLFEGQYIVPNGMAYNSYVINDEKIAVMDTVDAAFGDEWLKNIADVLNGATPDYLIIQHMEPDHCAMIDTLLRRYLRTDYLIAGGTDYTILDDNIGYLRYESFQQGMSDANLDQVMLHMAGCNGLIIDVRGNGGGLMTHAERLAARFCNAETTVGYLRHKTGRGHQDFSPLQEQTIRPAKGLRWQKEVVVLTNRGVFSAANEFVKYMSCFPRVTIVGDQTGGGAGMPFSAELPNGWGVRFSACPMYDRKRRPTEEGIAPDYYVSLSDEDFRRGRDTLIEWARKWLSEGGKGAQERVRQR